MISCRHRQEEQLVMKYIIPHISNMLKDMYSYKPFLSAILCQYTNNEQKTINPALMQMGSAINTRNISYIRNT